MLECAFDDLKHAFNNVYGNGLLSELIKNGIIKKCSYE